MPKKSQIERSKKKKKYKVREHNRCGRCGRGHSYIRKFDLCRICFRELALKGELPGIIKASW